MSNGQARLTFVVVFVINCVLFSQSRYGQVVSDADSSSFLLRRALDISRGTSSLALPSNDQCHPISVPIDRQCAHTREFCPETSSFLSIPYVQSYFCSPLSLRPLVFAGLTLWLVLLFSTLGISASDFFCPNLATLAQTLRLDENVAGVTFLAFGNGSPDVFSTFSAMRRHSGSLAIGELFGAASFIISCVVGSMCIIKPFKVDPYPFLRDAGFFTMAVTMLLVFLWDGQLFAWEAGSLVALYIVYVIVVLVGSWWERKQEKKRRIEAMIRDEYRPDQIPRIIEPYRDDPNDMTVNQPLTVPQWANGRPRARSYPTPSRIRTEFSNQSISRSPSPSPRSSHTNQMPSFSLIGALEFRQVVASLQDQAASSTLGVFEGALTPYVRGRFPHHHYHHSWSRPRTPVHADDEDPWDAALGVPLSERSPNLSPDGSIDQHQGMIIPSITHDPPSPSETDTESQHYCPPTNKQQIGYFFSRACHMLFPTLHHWEEKTVVGKIVSFFAAPAVMALTLTLPVVVTPYTRSEDEFEKSPVIGSRLIDFEEEGVEIRRPLIAEEEIEDELDDAKFSKWLMAVQCILGPLFCVGVLFNGTERQWWLLLATSIAGLAIACLVAVFATHGKNSATRLLRTCMGFFISMVWIMAIADEVVGVLQTFGFIFGLSDAIIGLTIFAVGNSLADLVANMSVAVFAPIMGFSACFGGPMLNMLLGVGISGSYIISQSTTPYILPFSLTLMVNGVGLLSLLLLTVIFVPFNGYYLNRKWGIFLVCCYVVVMSVTLVVELMT